MSDEEYKKIDYFSETTKEQRCETEIRSKIREWSGAFGVLPYWLDGTQKTGNIVRSWLYEYTIFELVRIYKSEHQ